MVFWRMKIPDDYLIYNNEFIKKEAKMTCRCAKCDINFASIDDYQKHKCEKEAKLTKEEATNKFNRASTIIDGLEALGLLKFDEPKKEVERLFEINANNVHYDAQKLYPHGLDEFNIKCGVVRLEQWSEGLVLWVGGEIVWKSWEPNRTKELVKKLASEVRIEVKYYDRHTNIAMGRITE